MTVTPAPMSPEEFRDHLAHLGPAAFDTVRDDEDVQACLRADETYREIYHEVLATNRLLRRFDVPAPDRNIAASVMARIAADEKAKRRSEQTIGARIADIALHRVQVPAWGIAAALALLVISAAINIGGNAENTREGASGLNMVEVPEQTPTQVILVPQQQSDILQTGAGAGPGPAMGFAPAWVVIMGSPPTGTFADFEPQPRLTSVSKKENQI